MTEVIRHIRNKDDNTNAVTLVFTLNYSTMEAEVRYSVCRQLDTRYYDTENFCRKTGVEIAKMRAYKELLVIPISGYASLTDDLRCYLSTNKNEHTGLRKQLEAILAR